MKLMYSKTGTPYIEFDESNMLIFSPTTATKDGYKYVVFSGVTTTSVAMSAGKGKTKTKKTVTITEPLRLIMDLSMKMSKTKTDNKFLTKKYMEGVKKLISPFVVDNVVPFKCMDKLAEAINKGEVEDPEDRMEEDPMGYYTEEELEEE